jgi:hypothetical protein
LHLRLTIHFYGKRVMCIMLPLSFITLEKDGIIRASRKILDHLRKWVCLRVGTTPKSGRRKY